MPLLARILVNNIVPIFLAIGAGYTLARLTAFDIGTLSKATLYVFSPSLTYHLLTNAEFQSSEFLRIVAVSVATILASGALAWIISRTLRLGHVMTTAFVLVAMFANAGNYGLSLNLLAFGEDAVARAVVYFVTSSALAYTLGIYLASRGRLSAGEALKSLYKMPPVYAVVLALLSVGTGISPPTPVLTTVEILSKAAIPAMLLVLGGQMSRVTRIESVRLAGVASALRLAVAPLVALGLVQLLQLGGLARQATVVEAGMPTAVLVTLLATEYDVEPGFVVSTVVLSTLLSPISLTLLVAFLS